MKASGASGILQRREVSPGCTGDRGARVWSWRLSGACREYPAKQACALRGSVELGSGARKINVCSLFVLTTRERRHGKQHAN